MRAAVMPAVLAVLLAYLGLYTANLGNSVASGLFWLSAGIWTSISDIAVRRFR